MTDFLELISVIVICGSWFILGYAIGKRQKNNCTNGVLMIDETEPDDVKLKITFTSDIDEMAAKEEIVLKIAKKTVI